MTTTLNRDLLARALPYLGDTHVVSGVQGDFDRQRALANQAAGQFATGQGAFGGDRADIRARVPWILT